MNRQVEEEYFTLKTQIASKKQSLDDFLISMFGDASDLRFIETQKRVQVLIDAEIQLQRFVGDNLEVVLHQHRSVALTPDLSDEQLFRIVEQAYHELGIPSSPDTIRDEVIGLLTMRKELQHTD